MGEINNYEFGAPVKQLSDKYLDLVTRLLLM